MDLDLSFKTSIAGLSIGALFTQIQDNADIESKMYDLSSQNAQLYVDMANQAKSYTEAAGRDQARGQLLSAISSIAGSGANLLATGASFYFTSQANVEEPAAGSVKATIEQEPAAVTTSAGTPSLVREPSGPEGERAIVTGRNVKPEKPETVTPQTDEEKVAAAKKARETKYNNYSQFAQMGGKFGSEAIVGAGGIAQSVYTDKYASDNGQQALYSGLIQIFGSTRDGINGAIQTAEAAKQAARQLAEALISANARA